MLGTLWVSDPFSTMMQTFAQNQPPYILFLPRHCPQPQGPRREVRDSCGTRPLSLLLTAPGGILLPLRDWGQALGQERADPREGRGLGGEMVFLCSQSRAPGTRGPCLMHTIPTTPSS